MYLTSLFWRILSCKNLLHLLPSLSLYQNTIGYLLYKLRSQVSTLSSILDSSGLSCMMAGQQMTFFQALKIVIIFGCRALKWTFPSSSSASSSSNKRRRDSCGELQHAEKVCSSEQRWETMSRGSWWLAKSSSTRGAAVSQQKKQLEKSFCQNDSSHLPCSPYVHSSAATALVSAMYKSGSH